MSLEIWDKCKRVPPEYLKTIDAGRLKGKSDINPQWRLKVLTEIFGPCGIGWWYTIDKLWTETGDGEVLTFATISLYYVLDGKTSAPIPGIGGSGLVRKEKTGSYNNDEAYKMAVTDAISVACKALGVGADVYEGKWDGSKYREKIEPSSLLDTALKMIEQAKTPEEAINIETRAAGSNKFKPEELKAISEAVNAKIDRLNA